MFPVFGAMNGKYNGMTGEYFKSFALAICAFMSIIMVVVAATSPVMGGPRDLILIILIAVVLALILFTNCGTVHISPALIIMIIATFFFSAVGRLLYDGALLNYAVNFLVGIDFGLVSLIMVYILLRFRSGSRHDNTSSSYC